MEEKEFRIKQYPLHEMPLSCTWVVIGGPDSGKTTFIQNLCYYNKHRIPTARVWCGTEDTQGSFKKYIPDLYITEDYNVDEHEKGILRQRTSMTEKCQNPHCIHIVDDCGDDKKNFNSKTMRAQLKNGRHWKDVFVIANQYGLDMEPSVRKCVSNIALAREDSPNERKKLYENFSIGCTYQEFNDLMDFIAQEKYMFLIIDRRSKSASLEDSVFYFKTVDMSKKKWEFGCEEYKSWHKERYNPKYTATFTK